MRFADRLRPPRPGDPLAAAYKDWLHLNLFDAASGSALIANASVHGAPGSDRAVASATALVREGGRWHLHADVVPQATARLTDRSLTIDRQLRMELDPASGGVDVRFRHPDGSIEVDVAGVPCTSPIDTPLAVPFGHGWIRWRAVPLMTTVGRLTVDGRTVRLDDARAYHDHNWGRWHWGDDIGWEWAALLGHEGCVVMSRVTGRAHRPGPASVTVALPGTGGWRSRAYGGGPVQIRLSDWKRGCTARIPGAMAALHCGRMGPRLPSTVEIVVDDGFDRLHARLDVDDAIQVITAEPEVVGYSFIHELLGRFRASGCCGGVDFSTVGEGAFEYVD